VKGSEILWEQEWIKTEETLYLRCGMQVSKMVFEVVNPEAEPKIEARFN
jgi:hypothetical protein